MAAGGIFGFWSLLGLAHTFARGIGAHFVLNTSKYPNPLSNLPLLSVVRGGPFMTLLNETLTNLLPTVLVPVRSVKCRVYRGLKWLPSGRSGSGKIHQDILQSGRKNNNMVGRSGIGVLVTGLSRVGALKKHAPLVFNSMGHLTLLNSIPPTL